VHLVFFHDAYVSRCTVLRMSSTPNGSGNETEKSIDTNCTCVHLSYITGKVTLSSPSVGIIYSIPMEIDDSELF